MRQVKKIGAKPANLPVSHDRGADEPYFCLHRIAMTTARVFSYVVTHDHGFAPNPYGGYLTLATCKPVVRRSARVGDWIVGTGSVAGVGSSRLVYAAQVSEVVPIEDYGANPRFSMKIPCASGREWQRHGDNIYYRDATGWRRRPNPYHVTAQQMARDLSGRHVLLCKGFWYFGRRAPELPQELLTIRKKGPGHKISAQPELATPLYEFLSDFSPGVARGARAGRETPRACLPGCKETD
jgi:Nucleotide modification associated domain 2